MAINPLTLRTAIAGTNITSYDITNSLVLGDKLEKTIKLKADDSPFILDFSGLEQLRLLFIVSDNSFTLRLNNGITDFNIINPSPFPILLPIDPTFFTVYTTLSLITDSITDIVISIKAYGEEIV